MKLIKRADAASLGLKRYFTGKPCPKGHISERHVNGKGCIECARATLKKWIEEHPEYVKLRSKRNARRLTLEKGHDLRAKASEYRAANRDKILAERKEFYRQNRELVLARVKKHSEKNRPAIRERNRRWRRENRELVATIDRNKRARRRSAIGEHTPQDVADIAKMQGNRCGYCRVSLKRAKRHVDHIKPLIAGGTNFRDNLQLLCEFCNLSKHARDPIDFAQSLGMLL
jgi:5-methylcytosine-specific restriction endonuclease McrA